MTKHLLLSLLLFAAQAAFTVEGVEISGIPEDRLSQALRDDLRGLTGQPYGEERAATLADRIQTELPEYIAAVRTVPNPAVSNSVRVVFVVARISDNDALGENINARYPVQSVLLEGVPRDLISDSLWEQMQKMVGLPLDNDEADRLRLSAEMELGTRYTVARKVRRGEEARQLTVVYEVRKIPILRWRSDPSLVSYHSKLGLTLFANDEFDAGSPDFLVRYGLGTNGDDLIERYKGFRVGFEKRNLGTERLAFRLDLLSFGTKWKSQTVRDGELEPDVPGVYRSRRAIEPSVALALTPDLYVTAGFSATELEMQFPDIHWESVRIGSAGLQYQRTFKAGDRSHLVEGAYSARTGARSLGSAFSYTRHFWEGLYVYSRNKNIVKLEFLGGRSTGALPLFERFSIGNTRTARGWNKFDIAPLGATRTVHGSVELGRKSIRFFYDAGAVWDAADPIRVRQSIGLTFGAEGSRADGYLTIGAAMRNSRLEPTITLRVGW